MKANFSRILAIATLGFIAICASASAASAQSVFKGTFTLPEDVQWGNALLPAGDYSFSLKSASAPAQITLNGPNGGAFILASVTDKREEGDSSNLTIERRGRTHYVHTMYLAELGLELRYQVPSIPKNERQLAQGPASTEHVLIAMAKN
jgi:hypothetical protein